MDIKSSFSTDSKKEVEGVWVNLDENSRIKIAKLGSREFQRVFNEISRPYRTAIRNKTLDNKTSEEILIKTFARAILVDWEGIKEGDQEVPYSHEKAEEYLRISAFRDFVTSCANDFTLFKEQEDKQDEKN